MTPDETAAFIAVASKHAQVQDADNGEFIIDGVINPAEIMEAVRAVQRRDAWRRLKETLERCKAEAEPQPGRTAREQQFFNGAMHVIDRMETVIVGSDMTDDPIKPVAWMHPEARWCDIDWQTIRNHCRNDGPMPVPLYGPELAERLEAAEARAERAEALTAEAEKAMEQSIVIIRVLVKPEKCAFSGNEMFSARDTLAFACATLTKIKEARHADNG